MQWDDRGIVLSVRRLGERSGIVHLLTAQHGLHAGVDKAAFTQRSRGLYQPGNQVQAHWQARLAEHMGTFSAELLEPVASHLLDSRLKLAALAAATRMVECVLHEREPQPQIFQVMQGVLQSLCKDEKEKWLKEYVRLEFALLECSGFGLDLETCAATGQARGLAYVSPRSGRAVCQEAGDPYKDRMFLYPEFLLQEGMEPTHSQLVDAFRLLRHFLQERVFAARNTEMPVARARLAAAII